MDELNAFLISTFGAKTASATPIEVVEPNAYDRFAFKRAFHEGAMDEKFLQAFDGSPLAPQAIALCEQELAMEQRHLQERMARSAQQPMYDYSKECDEREAMRLQKLGLTIQLHKMKVMGVGQPTPPGQAVIGTPDPAAGGQLGAEIGGGAAGGAPVQEPAAGKLASLITKFAAKEKTKEQTDQKKRFDRASIGATAGHFLGSPGFGHSLDFTPKSMIGSAIGGGLGGSLADGGQGALMGAAGAGGGAAMGALVGHGAAKVLKMHDPGFARGIGSMIGAAYGAPIAVEGGRALRQVQDGKTASLAELIQSSLRK